MSKEQLKEKKEDLIELNEEVNEDNVDIVDETEGMSDLEVTEAKDLGLIEINEEEDDSKKEDKIKKDKEGEEVVNDTVNNDPKDYEEMDAVMEKDEKKFHKEFTPNAKALYFKMKASKQKAKSLLVEIETLKKNIDPSAKASKEKLEKITKLLDGEDDLTVQELRTIINEKVEVEKDVKPINQAALKEKLAVKTGFISQIGNAKYENFAKLAELADEVVKADTSGVYESKISDAFLNDTIDETQAVDVIIKIAKFSDKYEEVAGSVKKPEKKEDNRVIKNSKKKVSSAAVGGASKGRFVSESDLTIEDIVYLQDNKPEAFNKLKPETIDRVLKQ